MKKLTSNAATLLIAAPLLMFGAGNASAEVAAGDTQDITFAGTGCAAGPENTEYASTAFTFGTPSTVENVVLHKDDVITQTATVSLQSALSGLPAACDGVAVNLSLSEDISDIGDNLDFTSVAVENSGDTTIGALKSQGGHTVTLKLTVNPDNATDLAEAIDYSIPVTVSLKALAN